MRRESFVERVPRSVFVWSGLAILFVGHVVFFAGPLLLLRALGLDRDKKLASRITSRGYRGFLAWCTWVGVARIRGGLERYRDQGPFVVVANHESNLDICLVSAFSPRPARLVAKAALRQVPIVGLAVDAGGSIFTDEDEGGALAEGMRAIRAGVSVGIFAEGTRSRGKGVRRFRKGAFEIAHATGAPILPIVIVGSGEFMPPGAFALGPYRVTVEALPPRRIEGDPDEARRALRQEIADAHARILAEPFHAPSRIERSALPTSPEAVES